MWRCVQVAAQALLGEVSGNLTSVSRRGPSARHILLCVFRFIDLYVCFKVSSMLLCRAFGSKRSTGRCSQCSRPLPG